MKNVRFKSSEKYDNQPIVIVTDRIVYARKIDDEHVVIKLDTGDKLYVKEQLNVVEARISMSIEPKPR
jgi:hypothetical protein